MRNKIIPFNKNFHKSASSNRYELKAQISVYISRNNDRYDIDWSSPDSDISYKDIYCILKRHGVLKTANPCRPPQAFQKKKRRAVALAGARRRFAARQAALLRDGHREARDCRPKFPLHSALRLSCQ